MKMLRSGGVLRSLVPNFLSLTVAALLPNLLLSQSLTLTPQQTTVPVAGLYEPLHLAVDPAGNVFVADWANNSIWKVLAAGGQTSVGTGLSQPSGVALDATGNVFIADSLNGRIVEVPQGGTQVSLTTGLNYPYAVTVDKAGNVFLVDTNHSRVTKLPAGGGAPVNIGSGWQYPLDIVVNSAGDVIVADAGLSQVVKLPAGGGPSVTIGSGFSNLWGVTQDARGNVFVADSNNNRVVEVPADGSPQFTVLSGLNFPSAVTFDTHGNLFISDRYNHRVIELHSDAPNFGSVNICPGAACSQTKTLTFNVNNNVTIGSIKALTTGAIAGDFTVASGSTCTATLTTGSTCTVNVTFKPQFPGLRSGAVVVLDAGGNLLGSTYLQGTGVGAELAFSPGTSTNIGSGLQTPQGVALDGAGNTYIADKFLGVVKVPAGGGALTQVGTGIGNAAGVAVDGAGNVFILDKANGLVSQVAAVGGAQTTLVKSLSSPSGIAVDGAGNIYVADSGNNRVLEIVAAGGAQIPVGSGLASPSAVAVDAAGNVFIADTGNNRVVEIPAGGGSQIVVNASLNSPRGLALDAAGDVYIADTGNNRIVNSPSGGFWPVVVETGSTLSGPLGLALDPAGNIFIADSGNARVLEMQRSNAPTLAFAATPQGSTSSDSPKSVVVVNIGNAPLAFSGLAVGSNFVQVSTGGLPYDCSSSTTLNQPSACTISISFKPTASGALTGSAVLTDNSLGQTPATQSITLKGQSLAIPTLTFAPLTGATVLGSATLSATTSSTSPVVFTSNSPTVCSVSGNKVNYLTTGACQLSASVVANSVYAAASVPQTFNVGLIAQTISFGTLAGKIQGTPVTLSATASSNLPVQFSSLTPTVCTLSGITVSTTNPGLCSIQATQPGNTNYAAATPVTQSFTVTPAFTLTITPQGQTILPGLFLLANVQIKAATSFTGTVSLSCAGALAGSPCTCSPLPVLVVNGTGFGVISIYVPFGTSKGTYTQNITLTSGAITNVGTVTFSVWSLF